MSDARQCPFCDFIAYSTASEVAHMEARHREIVAQRLSDAGFDAPTFHPPTFGAGRIAELQIEVESLRAELDAAAAEILRYDGELAAANWPHRQMAEGHPDLEPWQVEALAWVREREREVEQLRATRRELDRLVCEFCLAIGEPVPVDAIAVARKQREEVTRLRAYIGEAGPDTARFIKESMEEITRLRAALRTAPMPFRESTLGADWHEAYDKWWHANASEAALDAR